MILIISSEDDGSTLDVTRWLEKYNAPWVRLSSETKVRVEQYKVTAEDTSFVLMTPSGQRISSNDITAYWYRRSNISIKPKQAPFEEGMDRNLYDDMTYFLNQEYITLKEAIHFLLKGKRNLNDINNSSVNKLKQLVTANKFGIKTPDTLVTTSRFELLEFRKKHDQVITKMLENAPLIYTKAENGDLLCYQSYTSTFDHPEEHIPINFPLTLFQEKLEKQFEIRAFYLDGDFYSMAIFSQLDDQTTVDFRRYNLVHPNRNVPYNLPENLKGQLTALMKKLDLNCGSFDIVYTKEEEYVFLEVNPIGQFGMVSLPCNYKIEQKIAEYLCHE